MSMLAAPTIFGPISSCQDTVWLDNLVASWGETVVYVYVGTELRVHATVTASRMQLSVGKLKPGDQLTATQANGQFDSAGGTPNTHVVRVISEPSTLCAPVIREHYYRCSVCQSFEGLHPGASVTITNGTATVASIANVRDTATVQFDPSASTSVQQATLCAKSAVATLPRLDIPPATLPPPEVEGPLRVCQSTITLTRLFAGAEIQYQIVGESEIHFAAAGHAIETIVVAPLRIVKSMGRPSLSMEPH